VHGIKCQLKFQGLQKLMLEEVGQDVSVEYDEDDKA